MFEKGYIAMSFADFEKRLGYVFKKQALLKQALTHKSCDPHAKPSAFERLEFFGDRVLGFIISQKLYKLYPFDDERNLALRFSQLVDRKALYQVAKALDLQKDMVFDRRALQGGVAQKILSDAIEALIAALFLDAGMQKTRLLVEAWWAPLIKAQGAPTPHSKSALQEVVQKHYGVLPIYELVSSKGPDHAPLITIVLRIDAKDAPAACQGTGASRRKAEEVAAQKMLRLLEKKV